MTTLTGGVSKSGGLMNSLKNGLGNLLFLETFRNLNWSRGYDWYVELDDVPSPFHRGGVLGLPVTNCSYEIITPKEHSWTSSTQDFTVPLSRGTTQFQITMIDDEKGTLEQFFERWYNNIYNNRSGVLPLNECVKTITIYHTKSTRTRVERSITSPDMRDSDAKRVIGFKWLNVTFSGRTVYGRTFTVYPCDTLQFTENATQNEPRSFSVTLRVVSQPDADFGNPSVHGGETTFTIGGKTFNAGGDSFLSKVTNFI